MDFISFVMSKKYGKSSDIYAKEVKDHLNDARDTAAGEDKVNFPCSFRIISVLLRIKR